MIFKLNDILLNDILVLLKSSFNLVKCSRICYTYFITYLIRFMLNEGRMSNGSYCTNEEQKHIELS